ncbi:hypothetical protein CLAIMM_12694 [Cladophialophora immunda]|nr:hypothetical protein CLAIMM_12694 [Cladophialophora immunda]
MHQLQRSLHLTHTPTAVRIRMKPGAPSAMSEGEQALCATLLLARMILEAFAPVTPSISQLKHKATLATWLTTSLLTVGDACILSISNVALNALARTRSLLSSERALQSYRAAMQGVYSSTVWGKHSSCMPKRTSSTL